MTTPIKSSRLATDPSLLNSESEPERPPLSTRVLARRVDEVPRSGIRRFFDITATMTDVISLGVGEPDFDTPQQVIEAGIHSLESRRTHYTSNYGTIELRRALAHHLERLYGVKYDPTEEILITVGASEALDMAIRATLDPGDEVILHEPSYVSYRPAVIFAGGVPVGVNTTLAEDFAIDPAKIEAAITPRTKAILLNYPCNPTGAVLPADVQDEIARIAVRHDLLVYSDEIYDRLVYGGYQMRSMAALPGMRRRTILMGGFSKAYAMTGWRIGYVCAPSEILEGILKVHQYMIMSAATVAQDAALEALKTGEPDVARMLAHYDRRRRIIVDGFNEIGLTTFEPRGAFYAFPQISSTGLTSDQFAEQLIREESVAVVPGTAFGAAGEGHVRCCYATSEAEIKEALVRIGRFVERRKSGANG
jgi:aminotransferase